MVTVEELAAEVGRDDFEAPTEVIPEAEPFGHRTYAPERGRLVNRPIKRNIAIYLEVMEGKRPVQVIAKEYGLSAAGLWYVTSSVDKWLNGNLAKKIDELKMEQDLKLRQIEARAQEAFQKSTQKKRTVKKKTGMTGACDADGNAIGIDTKEVTTEEQCGDPRFLNVELVANKQRNELWGLNAPKKTALTNIKGDGPAEIEFRLDKATDDELRLLRQANRALMRLGDKPIDAEYTIKDQTHDDGSGTHGAGGSKLSDRPGTRHEESGGDADSRPAGGDDGQSAERDDGSGAVPLCETGLALRGDRADCEPGVERDDPRGAASVREESPVHPAPREISAAELG